MDELLSLSLVPWTEQVFSVMVLDCKQAIESICFNQTPGTSYFEALVSQPTRKVKSVKIAPRQCCHEDLTLPTELILHTSSCARVL